MLSVVRSDVDAVVALPVTVEDLASLEGDGYRYDLLEDNLIRVSPAGFRHGRLAAEIARRLGNFLVQHPDLGVVVGAETGFRRDATQTPCLDLTRLSSLAVACPRP